MTTQGDSRYGASISTFVNGGLDPNMRLVTGPVVVVESIVRSWLTPRGSLITNPNRGVDVREWLGSDMAAGGDYARRAALLAEAQQDDRVEDIDLDVAFDRATETLTVTATIKLADAAAPFDVVVRIGALTKEIIMPKDLAS